MLFGLGLTYIVSLITTGALVGVLSGFFGIGGGVILVPTLYLIFQSFDIQENALMHMAVATSLASMMPACARTVWRHYRLDNIDFNLIKKWLPGVLVGAVVGLAVMNLVSTAMLKTFFIGYMYLSLVWLWLIKTFKFSWHWHQNVYWSSLLSWMVGMLSVLIGIGGGTFTVPLFRHAGFVPKRASAISAASGCLVATVGTVVNVVTGIRTVGITEYAVGYVNLWALLVVVPVVWYVAPHAASIAHRWTHHRLQQAYLWFLLVLTLVLTVEHYVVQLY